MNDSEIVRLFWERDEKALSETERSYGKRCRTIAKNILGSREDSEDCVNDAYLKLWELIPPERPRILGAFIAGIVKYTAIDMLKARLAQKRGKGEIAAALDELEECVSDKTDIEHTFENKEMIEKINEFLRGLSDESRRAFILRYWYCCELTEIANRLGMRKNTVSVSLNRTRRRLREYLIKEGYEP